MQIRKLAVDIFRSNAQMAFQSGSRLRDRVYTETGVQAETVHFPVFGTGDARTRASQADIVPANLANKRPSVKLEPFEWFDLLDRQDTALTNVDAARNYGIVAGRALGRQFDQHIIAGALQPGAGNANVSNAYSRSGMPAGGLAFTTAGSGLLGIEDLGKAAAMIMDEVDGDAMDLTLVAPALQFEEWSKDDKFLRMEYLQQGRGQSNVMVTGNFGGHDVRVHRHPHRPAGTPDGARQAPGQEVLGVRPQLRRAGRGHHGERRHHGVDPVQAVHDDRRRSECRRVPHQQLGDHRDHHQDVSGRGGFGSPLIPSEGTAMAFKDAKIGIHTSSTGAWRLHHRLRLDHGIRLRCGPIAYWANRPGKDSNENLTARRTYDALVDFIELQSGPARMQPLVGS